ncbi:ABC transporter substrate-binding protein [Pseudonocardia sp. MH-G8]|uniref:ABC transporter substrate-binding protein n=1 Tax=Pseudonocardia sp. MH-G8 TaxID=1854588 RepID=UPI00130401E2|nr:extracellular solute-binding protein [Pseudonocardia sp. MH-G8]
MLSLAVFAAGCADTASDAGGGGGSGAELAAPDSPHLEAARAEGQVTWYTSHYSSETAEAIAGLFEEAYPGITVTLYRQTAQRIYQRFAQEQEAGQTVADLLGITEVSLVADLASKNQLARYVPTNAAEVDPAYAAYNDPDGYYHVANVGNNIISYNTDMLSEQEAPHSWQDLLDPKWRGQIATGNPGASGYVGTWATWAYLEFGPGYLEQLAAQDVLVGQSITDTIPRVAAGERAVGVSSDQTTAKAAAAGDPIGIIYPDDGAVVMPTPNAIPAAAPHPAAAKLLADFIISKPVQQFLVESEALIPLTPGIEPPAHVRPDATYVRPELQELTDNLETVIGEWRRLFGV